MHPLHRNARLSSERPRQWPLAVAAASMVVLCVSVVVLRASAPPRPSPPPAAPEPVHQPWAEVERDELPPRVVAGTCDLSLLPASMVEEPAEDDAAALRVMLNEWLGAPHAEFRRGPGIEHRRGIVHVESEEDRGDDPPYPRSAEPEAQRVCGSAAAWLRTHLRERLQFEGLACQGNVCCFDGMEYHPAGLVVFRRGAVVDGPDWMIDGWIEVHVAALAPEIVLANRRHAETSLRRLADTRCPGEPPGSD